jgi:tetratricopeptide (TPR) repeat protein
MRSSTSSDPWQAFPRALQDEERLLRLLARAAGAALAGPPDAAAVARFRYAGGLFAGGDAGAAAAAYAEALRHAPGFAQAWAALGLCLGRLGHARAQIASCDTALRLNPDFAEAHLARAAALMSLGRATEAAQAYEAAARLQQDSPQAWAGLGRALRMQGKAAAAATAFAAAVARAPGRAELLVEQGTALREARAPSAALSAYEAALGLEPENAVALCNSGSILQELGRLDEAIGRYRGALAARPAFAGAWRNLGTALQTIGRFEDAVCAYRSAIRLDPRDAAVHTYLGAALNEAGWPEAADAAFADALALAPDDADAHFNRGLALLKAGRLREGWAEHEWRWRGILPPHGIAQPQWRGESADGRRILLHHEQGFGDALQFLRYVKLVVARGFVVILEVPRPLFRLARGLPGVETVLACGERRPEFDLHCPLMSLPFAFATELASIPSSVPYLSPPADCTARWRRLMPEAEGVKVGLVWAGNPRPGEPRSHFADRRRSVDLATLAPLAQVAGVRWFSLQKDRRQEPGDGVFNFTDLMPEAADFADTAALIDELDLVIAVDTAVAHLAGALGKPVWVLSRFDGCWRWLQGRDDTPWYPTMRLYRQEAPGDWAPVIARLTTHLTGQVPYR